MSGSLAPIFREWGCDFFSTRSLAEVNEALMRGPFYIKRIVALASDEIEMLNGELHLNGEWHGNYFLISGFQINEESFSVPQGICFV